MSHSALTGAAWQAANAARAELLPELREAGTGRTVTLQVVVSEREAEQVREVAKTVSLSVSSLIRLTLVKALREP